MNRKRLTSIAALLISAIIIIIAASLNAANASAQRYDAIGSGTHGTLATTETFANCRYGAAPAEDDSGEKTAAISDLGAGWYLTFGTKAQHPQPANGSDFVHMLHVRQKKDGFAYLTGYDITPKLTNDLANYIKDNPGDIWILGNEVDRGPSPGETNPDVRGQGDTHPEVYALAFHEAYNFIKQADPTAQVATSGLVQVTPGRLQYLDKVWSTYKQTFGQPMPVDIWTMHLYILPEVKPDGKTPNGVANVALGTDPTLGKRESGGDAANCAAPGVYCFAEHDKISVFAEQVVAMRSWMADHGQKEKPLLLTEFSILYPYIVDGDTCFIQDEFGQCFTPDRVNNFMTQTYNYLNNLAHDPNLGYSLDNDRLIQQYMWFSVYNEGVGEVSNLLQKDLETMTILGQNFKNHVTSEDPTRNLLVESVASDDAIITTEGTATAKLTATFRNNGNTKIDQPFTVTFYEDSGLTKPIASTNITANVFGCANRPYLTSVDWPGLNAGVYNYWVKIDSGDDITELTTADNIGSGNVRVVKNGAFLPMIQGLK